MLYPKLYIHVVLFQHKTTLNHWFISFWSIIYSFKVLKQEYYLLQNSLHSLKIMFYQSLNRFYKLQNRFWIYTLFIMRFTYFFTIVSWKSPFVLGETSLTARHWASETTDILHNILSNLTLCITSLLIKPIYTDEHFEQYLFKTGFTIAFMVKQNLSVIDTKLNRPPGQCLGKSCLIIIIIITIQIHNSKSRALKLILIDNLANIQKY